MEGASGSRSSPRTRDGKLWSYFSNWLMALGEGAAEAQGQAVPLHTRYKLHSMPASRETLARTYSDLQLQQILRSGSSIENTW